MGALNMHDIFNIHAIDIYIYDSKHALFHTFITSAHDCTHAACYGSQILGYFKYLLNRGHLCSECFEFLSSNSDLSVDFLFIDLISNIINNPKITI